MNMLKSWYTTKMKEKHDLLRWWNSISVYSTIIFKYHFDEHRKIAKVEIFSYHGCLFVGVGEFYMWQYVWDVLKFGVLS